MSKTRMPPILSHEHHYRLVCHYTREPIARSATPKRIVPAAIPENPYSRPDDDIVRHCVLAGMLTAIPVGHAIARISTRFITTGHK